MPKVRRARCWAAVAAVAALGAGCVPQVDEVTPPEAAEATGRPLVLTSFTVLADMASVVAGPHLDVESIIDVAAEIHAYEPTPGDLSRAAEADLMLVNGLGLEAWIDDLLAPLDLPTVRLAEQGVDTLAIHDAGGPVNPHAWMSPREGQRYVNAIAEALTGLAPEHADDFRSRAAAYSSRLESIGSALRDRVAAVPPDHRLLVTCEGAFSYLARDAGLTEAYLWPVNAERQGTPRQVAAVIRAVRAADVPSVFCESTVPWTAQEQVARETGAVLGGVLYVDSLSSPDGPVPSYLDLLRHDIDVIVAGLTDPGPVGAGLTGVAS